MTQTNRRLTGLQRRFVLFYLHGPPGIACNATQAAIKAGYSRAGAHSRGHENLKHPVIRTLVDEHLDEFAEEMRQAERARLQAIYAGRKR